MKKEEPSPLDPDKAFLEELGLVDPEEARIALAVRAAVAKLGEVDTQKVKAETTFASLDYLPFWRRIGDAGFDTIIFINEIGRILGEKIDPRDLDDVFDPDLNIDRSIGDFARAMCSALRK